MNDLHHIERTVVELNDDELETVSGSENSNVHVLEMLSNVLQQMHDVRKAIVANMRA